MATGLAEYLIKRFTAWKKDREKLQKKWQNNLNAMKREDPADRKPFKTGEGEGWRSSDYVAISKAKVLTVFSILVQTVLGGGMIPFKLEASPFQRDQMVGQEEVLDEFTDQMEDRIREQHSDRKADREAMKKLLSLMIYGMCVSKYNLEPIPKSGFRQMDTDIAPELQPYMEQESIRFEEYQEVKTIPGHVYTSIWNMFWDQESAANFQKNAGYCERQLISIQQLRAKKGKPFYLDERIDKAIADKKSNTNPTDNTDSLPPGQREITERKRTIRNLEFWCRAPKPLVKDILSKRGERRDTQKDYAELDEHADEVEILCELADDEVIRLAINDSGKRPHRDCYWEMMLDEAGGETITDNMEGIQYLFNGILRSGLDNYRLAANVIFGLKERYFSDPSQLDEGVYPGKRYDIADSCDDVRKAMQQVIIQDVSKSAMPWLQQLWAVKDTVSNVPDILQGTIGPQQKGDTAYEWSQRLDFGSKYIGMGIRNFDEMIIEPEVNDLYVFNMKDPEYQGAKGDFICHAAGFTSFQEKLVKTQKLKELLALMLTTEGLGIYAKVRPHIEQIYKGLDLDPDEFLRTEEEVQMIQQAQMLAEQQAMQAQAQMQANNQAQTAQMNNQAKAESDQVKMEGERMKIDAQSKADEENFQRDVIKEGIKMLAEKKKETTKEG
jgi:hypothetical protein